MDMAGLTTWIPKQNRKPLDPAKMMTETGDFGSISVPVYDQNGNVAYNVDMAVHAYAQRADTSAANGSKQDVVIEVEVSLDTAYVSAPLSALRATGGFAGKDDSVVYGFGQQAS